MAIKFKNLHFSYDNKKEVISNFNGNFITNEITGIIGKNGSGKSTLIDLILKFLNPNKGEIFLYDESIKNYTKTEIKNLRKKVTVVFGDVSKNFFCDNVYDEISFFLKLNNVLEDELMTIITETFQMLNLSLDILKLNPNQLSGGEAKKLALAIVLTLNTDIIILDEVTTGLDEKSKNNLINIIKKLTLEYSKTFIIVSHDIEFIYRCCDNIFVIDKGKNIFSGTKTKFLNNNENLINYIELPKIEIFKMYARLNGQNLKSNTIDELIKEVVISEFKY